MRRLTYANVMATLAFFFALTGGAMAVGKYLLATDTIPATSDLAGSTYGEPLIAAGKVTTGKIADGAITSAKFNGSAVAPDATKFGGLAPSAYATKVASGTVNVSGSPLPGTCALGEALAPAGVNPSTDYVVVAFPSTGLGYASLDGYFTSFGLDTLGVGVTVCNVGFPGALSFSGAFRFVILR